MHAASVARLRRLRIRGSPPPDSGFPQTVVLHVGEIDPVTGRAVVEAGWERRVGGCTPLSEFRSVGRRL
jgi:hypothetical protein